MNRRSRRKRRLARLVIVANRLPVERVRQSGRRSWRASPGGLVSAMDPVLKRGRGAWVGWAGTAGVTARRFDHEGVRIQPVGLSPSEVETYYHGFCNRTIWPLFHDALRPPEFRREWWGPFVAVNRRFAEAAARACGRGDLIWIHDYQLQLVPRMLRELRPDLRIGFFLHIPFPPEELFAWLPWRRLLLEGLLGADLVGFQTHASAQNFSRSCRRWTAADGTDLRLTFQRRAIHISAFPISIDFAWYTRQAERPETTADALELRRNLGENRRILLSIERLDYTKGIEHRLRAYEELLARRRISVDDCVLIQIASPSRENVVEYAEQRRRIEQAVGRINGEFSVPGRVAVHYFRRSFSRESLVPYYRAADVMIVTPLRDGMNLVAKEYVASRVDGGGVLVLSEFAGAAEELRRAVLVNPHDIEGMARAYETALQLSTDEARMRMAILRMTVKRHDVHVWAGNFLEALRKCRR